MGADIVRARNLRDRYDEQTAMDKTLKAIFGVFLAVGLVLCGVAAYFTLDTQSFIDHAAKVRGEVIDLERSRGTWSTSSPSSSGAYYPVVKFTTQAGEQRTFRGSVGSSPPAFRVGETVDVLYDRTNPPDARIASFWSLWLIQIIVGGLGSVFALVGGGVLAVLFLLVRRARDLRRHGTPIETEFQNIEVNAGVALNGRSPWRIVSRWLDPAKNALYLYHSENLWFDPTPYIKVKRVTVFIDPTNPKRYSMDVSFLPKLAN